MMKRTGSIFALMALTTAASAAPLTGLAVQVTATGFVEFNQVTAPPLGLANPGDPATMSFMVDAGVFTDSESFPTRGYDIIQSTFSLTLGAAELGLQDPFPATETPYFVLRDNDPAVDGFFVATSVDFPIGAPIDQTGIFEQFRNNYSVTYGGDLLSSLDILDAVGSYDFDGLTVFNWTIDDGPFNAVGIIFEQMTITPEPASLGMLLPLALVTLRRRG